MIEYGLEWSSLDSYFQLKEQTSVDTPEDGHVRLYGKDNGSGVSTLCYKNDAGTEVCMPTSGSFVTGTGVDNQLAIWNGTNAIDNFALTQGSILFGGASSIAAQDNANLFWDDTNNRLGIGINASLVAPLHVKTAATLVARFDGSSASAQLNIDFAQAANNRWIQYLTASATPNMNFFNVRLGADIFRLLDSGVAEAVTVLNAGTGYRVAGGATSGNVLRGNGTNFVDATLAGSDVTGAALTKTDDTNVTLTLGGTPTTALLRAASLTLGWTGTLAISRGGTGQSTANAAFNALAPSQTSNSGKFLTTDGTNTSWAAVSGGVTDHGALTGLADDDHTQYALLAGRSGGQTLIGGTAASNKLILQSTSNATRGDIDLDGGDLTFTSGMRARMISQNRFRYLNTQARVYKSANQTIATGTLTILTFDSEDYDTDTLHDTVTNNSRITIALTGKYFVFGLGQWVAGAGTLRQNLFLLNGSGHFSDVKAVVGAGAGTDNVTSFIDNFNAGDYLELQVLQDSGGNLDVVGGTAQNTVFGAVYLGE